MLAAFGVLAAGAAIVLIEIPFLRKRSKKEMWTFAVTLAVALALAVAKSVRVPLPNPLDWIAYLYKPFSDIIFRWLS
ncbi:hypothetical protein FE783_23745 [Paenibacillus mesophilus]|uniref:hypothetical protein n=1 Tax=Paenibacillus mesophilus TaxID=2582849 RepID=UPI00110D6A80|nr:hypothetical protein [Paenibacillus mesophilus]TMV46943.1 hypothetical protein FE783_23745 [Paenibacillus mesophilus]